MDSIHLDRNLILDSSASVEDARHVLLGVPFDGTATYRPGQRFAPLEVRRQFLELDKEGFFDVPFADVGNVDVVHGSVEETLRRAGDVVGEILEKSVDVVPIVLGGEHSITLPVVASLTKFRDINVLAFDAHADLRDDYMGQRLSHATVLRRIAEEGVPVSIVGVRSITDEEQDYAKDAGIGLVPENEFPGLLKKLKNKKVYITVDMDYVNSSEAPGTGNPTPGGASFNILYSQIIRAVTSLDVTGFDVVEVCPPHDVEDITSTLASKLLLGFMEKR